jgi:hypothetical protein
MELSATLEPPFGTPDRKDKESYADKNCDPDDESYKHYQFATHISRRKNAKHT